MASDGTVLLNLAHFNGIETVENAAALMRGLAETGATVFVGGVLSEPEIQRVLGKVGPGFSEAAAYTVGKRQTQQRRRWSRSAPRGSRRP